MPHAHRGWTNFLAHRWPTALGIAVAALTAIDLRIDIESVSFLSALVLGSAILYLRKVGESSCPTPRGAVRIHQDVVHERGAEHEA